MELGIKNKHALIDLARHGTLARKHIHPDLLIGNYPVGKNVFREGDILDANGVLNLILTNKGTGSGTGEKGEPGITPHIGDNGNWFIGDEDTGVKSEGRDGISPVIRINPETFEWEISNDGGVTYISTEVVAKGIQGEQGPLGLLGERGPMGEQGPEGPLGPRGELGPLGPRGELGPHGPQGELGLQGPQGILGIQGLKGDTGLPFTIWKQYDDISLFDPSDFPSSGLIFVITTDDGEGFPVYLYDETQNPQYSLITHLNILESIVGATGPLGPLGIQGPLGERGETGRGIKSIIQTTKSTENAGTNIITITFNDDTTASFSVLNGDIDTSDTYRKELVDALIRSVQGQISSTNGPMTVISQETENGSIYIAYKSMDIQTASTVNDISFIWTDVDGDIIYGNNLQYYKEVIFGNETLTNVWCTPPQLTEPASVKCTILYYDPARSPIMDYAYDHAFMKQTEYDALSTKDPNTIYFIWNAEEGDEGTSGFPYTFPIILDGESSASIFPAVFPITLD